MDGVSRWGSRSKDILNTRRYYIYTLKYRFLFKRCKACDFNFFIRLEEEKFTLPSKLFLIILKCKIYVNTFLLFSRGKPQLLIINLSVATETNFRVMV